MGRIVRVAEWDAVERDVELAILVAAPAALRIAHCAIGVVREEAGGHFRCLIIISADRHDVSQDLVADDGHGLGGVERAL